MAKEVVYHPVVKEIDSQVIWAKVNKTTRLEVKASFTSEPEKKASSSEEKKKKFEKVEFLFQQLKEEGGRYRQTSLISIYLDVDEVLWLCHLAQNHVKENEKGVLYNGPAGGTSAEKLEARGIGRNGYAEYRSFGITKGQKGWLFTAFSCDGIQNQYGLFNPRKDANGKLTGVTKTTVLITPKEFVAMAYRVQTELIAYRSAQWVNVALANTVDVALAPAAEPAAEPISEPAAEPASEPAAEPVVEDDMDAILAEYGIDPGAGDEGEAASDPEPEGENNWLDDVIW